MFLVQVLLLIVVSLVVSSEHSGKNINTNNEIALTDIINKSTFDGSILAAATTTTNTTSQPFLASQEIKTPTTIETTNPLRVLKRGKRYLDFLETTRMFFRVNAKNNIIKKPTVWAHGYGFRCNFPMQNNRKARPFRRDTYDSLGELIDKSGFDGEACILKAYCAAHMDDIDTNKGMLFKLLKYIFTLNEDDKRHFPYLRHENCQQILHSHCPLSFNNISPYTDDI